MALSSRTAARATSTVATALVVALIVATVVALAVGLRWAVCDTVETAATPPGDHELPYTLEGALLFHYADEYRSTGRIPRVDERVNVPDGLHVARELSLGKGLVAAWLYNGAGVRGMSFQRFVRRFDAAWYSLGVIPLFLLVWGRTRSLLAASLASLLLAGAYTAVARSTGLEFSPENFALPLVFAHFWLLDAALRRRRLAPSVAAAVVLAVALAAWDMARLYLLLVVAYWAVRCLVRRAAARQLVYLAPTVAAGFVAGLFVPYLRAHAFCVGYAMLVGYGLVAWWLVEKRLRLSGPAAKGVLAAVLAGALIVASALPAGTTYGPFGRLFFAKLGHLNVKPEEPERLGYDARVLWTAGLRSATARDPDRRPIADFVPMFLLGLIAVACVVAAKLKRRDIGELSLPVAMLLAWLVLYVLFVRMQVFLVFFLAAFVGIGVGAVGALAGRRWPVLLAAPVVVLVLVSDLGQRLLLAPVSERYKLYEPASRYALYENAALTKLARSYGRGFPYAGAAALVEWLRDNTPPEAVVLAPFMLEPTIFEYAERRIVLHPAFESRAMRETVREYLESFYAPSERAFYEFCARHDVDYFVLENGMFVGPDAKGWVYSPRYMAAAGDAAPAGTACMDGEPDKCGYFRLRTEIGAVGERAYAYRVFEVVRPYEMDEARLFVQAGARFLENYKRFNEQEDLDLAADALERAVKSWPGCRDAWRLMVSVYALMGNENRALEAKTRWETLDQQEQPQP
jgi:hypothetical protein